MLVFIDESGDAGFKVNQGSSPVFAVAMVIFADGIQAAETEGRVRTLMSDLNVKPEFKFSKCSDSVRDAFFSSISTLEFSVRCLVVKKQNIVSKRLKEDKELFYNYFVKQLIKYDGNTLSRARVRIDGSGERAFRQELSGRLRRDLGGRVSDVRFSDSRCDPLVQLADMAAGAIARSRREDRSDARRWMNMLRPRSPTFGISSEARSPSLSDQWSARTPYGDSSGTESDFPDPDMGESV